MFFKYFIKFKYCNQSKTTYIKAKDNHSAILKLLETYKKNSITAISIEGDPLPTRQDNATHLIKKKEEAKERKRKGAIKYYQLTGNYVNQK
jgi:hypothetical protein